MPQSTATTVPVPACPGSAAYPGSVLTMTILGMLPDVMGVVMAVKLEAITAMKEGTVAGGPELFPGSVIHVPPQAGGVVLVVSAKPLKASGAGPPLSELSFAH